MIHNYWAKLIKKLPGSYKKNVKLERPAKIEARSTVINTEFGRYSYCGYNCTIINCKIGRFSSIADNVVIGNACHPMDWVSTSPAFYKGRDSIPKNLAKLQFDPLSKNTIIGNDVWIGESVLIKAGITVGDGAIIGMGSVVTKDVPSYSIVAGVPARIIRYRFDEDIIEDLLRIAWWSKPLDELLVYSPYMNNIEEFIKKAFEREHR